jgi:ketosteroid isomerase-like protein
VVRGRPADTAPPFRQLGYPAAGTPGGDDEREVLELMRQYAAAQTRHDESFFEQAEADSYIVHVRYGGSLTKSQVITAMKGWDTGIRYAHEDLRVQIVGDVAIVTGWMTATHTGSEAYSHRGRSIYLLRKSEGRWQILSATQAN